MKKPEAVSSREFVEGLPYIGEYYQPDDRVYPKKLMDRYIDYLEAKIQTNKSLDEMDEEKQGD